MVIRRVWRPRRALLALLTLPAAGPAFSSSTRSCLLIGWSFGSSGSVQPAVARLPTRLALPAVSLRGRRSSRPVQLRAVHRGGEGAAEAAAAAAPAAASASGHGAAASGEGSEPPMQEALTWLPSFLAAALAVALVALPSPAALADSKSMAAVAPCLLSQCQLPLAKCILDPKCAIDLSCIISCSGRPDEASCQIKCGDSFEDDVVTEFNACALSAKKCVPQRPDVGLVPGDSSWEPVNGRYPVPPKESVSTEFDVTKMNGRWFISAGLNPLFDTFDCQAHFFEGFAPEGNNPGRIVGKINWRIAEADGEFLSKSTVQTFKQTSPGVLENHGNEYLHYQDDWYVLDHGDEDDPDLGFVLIYYRGQNDAWAGYGGGTLYTRAKTVPPQILQRVREATARASVPYDKFWRTTDNSCAASGDPAALRAQFAKRLVQQAELSAEAQLTYLARSTLSVADKQEKEIERAAGRLEKLTENFAKEEAKFLSDELEVVGKELKKDTAIIEEELEKDEKLFFETPLRNLMDFLFGRPAKV